MLTRSVEPVWPRRLARISSKVRAESIRFPNQDRGLAQDEEWCLVEVEGDVRRIRFHDYHEVYSVPGLYENLFYSRLRCCSPSRVTGLLGQVMAEHGQKMSELRVLDVGAGNGMVGDELMHRGVKKIVGVDIIEEAREAAVRDRPGVYADYLVTDLTDLPERDEERLRKHKLNGLTTVAALGFGDVPAGAFLKALDVIDTPSWLAINIKEDFLREQDSSGFSQMVRELQRRGVILTHVYWRYSHRVNVAGKRLYYLAKVAQKVQDLPDDIMERFSNVSPDGGDDAVSEDRQGDGGDGA
ncbi:MAG: class I SAM-dependent methyltransferase [Phycisphaeraceae bacterium]|nr:class I SAM-dependent methyltransferase [Phycisphaeraceae bacterium]